MKIIIILFLFVSLGCGTKNLVKTSEEEVKHSDVIENKEVKGYTINFVKAELLSEVLNRAEKENKWIYLDVGAQWCLPCKIMKRDVYTNDEIGKIVNENFIPYIVDVEKGEGPDLKIIFDINAYPTLLFIDSKGRVKMKKEAALTSTGLTSFVKEALKMKFENKF